MATFRYDPYLWVHLAGLATVPLWLAICGLGLAVGYPTWPGAEQGVMAVLGVLPICLVPESLVPETVASAPTPMPLATADASGHDTVEVEVEVEVATGARPVSGY